MFEILGAVIVVVLVVAFWNGLWTVVVGGFFMLIVLMLGGGFIWAALYNDTVIAIVLALAPAALFMVYRNHQIRQMERMHLQQRIMRTQISTQDEEFRPVGIQSDGSIVDINQNRVFPTDRRCASAYSDSIAAGAAAFVYDREKVKSILRSEVEDIILQGQDNTSGAGVSIDPEGTKRRGRV